MIARALLLVAFFVLPAFCEFLTDAPASIPADEGVWLDMYSGREMDFVSVMDDLQTADVVYLGESHDSLVHRRIHEIMIGRLCDAGLRLVLVMEQIERASQGELDEYNSGRISFEEFSQKTAWGQSWSNWAEYRTIMEKVRLCGGAVAAGNAPAPVISKVSRTGIGSLDEKERATLPAAMDFNSPAQEKLLDRFFEVHSFVGPERKRFMFEAQASRDEAIAETAAGFLGQGPSAGGRRIVVVLAGSMHVSHGLGVPDRLRRRAGAVRDRIILISGAPDAGRTVKSMARDVVITHDDFRAAGRPAGDYIYIIRTKE